MDQSNVKESNIYRDDPINYYLNIIFCGDDFWDLIQMQKDDIPFSDKDYWETTHPTLKWPFYLYEDFNENIATRIKEKIITICNEDKDKCKNNVVICKLKKNPFEQAHLLIAELSRIPNHSQPIIVFIINGKETQQELREDLKEAKYSIDLRDVFLVKCHDNDSKELYERLFMISCYYNQLGDDYAFPLELSKNQKTFKRIEEKHLFKFKIVMIGNSCSGKSTFLNQIMGEKRSIERKGTIPYKKIIRYKHDMYPLAIYDTPSIDNKQDRADILQQLQNNLQSDQRPIQLILYFINGNSRNYKTEDFPSIQLFYQLKIPIWFLITFCDSEKKCIERKQALIEELKEINISSYVFPINNRKPINGYKTLFNTMYNEFLPLKNDNEKCKKIINDCKVGLVLGAARQVGLFLETYTNKEMVYYYLMSSMSLADNTFEMKIKMVQSIADCYLINYTINQAAQLIESFEWDKTIKSFASEISMKKDDSLARNPDWVYQTVISFDQSDLIDEKLFKVIYIKAVPYLNKLHEKHKETHYQIMTLNAISLSIIACRANTEFSRKLLQNEDYTTMVNIDINESITCLKTIAEMPNLQDQIHSK